MFLQYKQFYINDYVSLSENIQFKFIAEDIAYNDDNGSGGSLVEAAIDDFTLQVFLEGEQCNIGDLNEDALFNVQDIVIMVNVILGPIDNHFSYLCLADMNSDGQLNVQDIVLLVNLILR